MGKIKVTPCDIKGLYVIEPSVFPDSRGYFMETYNQNDFKEAGLNMVFVQDNQSMSVKGVLRGLHFQKQFPQGKLVRAVRGSVFDVAVDLSSDSETYGKWFGVELTAENKKQFWSDPEIGIDWPIEEGMELIISDKDQKWSGIRDTFKF